MSRGLETIRRRLRPAAALLALVLLASCGGGDRVTTFRPGRLVVLGDENNVIVGTGGSTVDVDGNTITATAGAKYSVNALAFDANGVPTGAYLCNANGIWHQTVANYFGFGYPECNPFVGAPTGRIYARVGARIANLAAQVTAANAELGAFASTDLVTVMVGQRDIYDAYEQYRTQALGAEAVVVLAEASGRALGAQVNAIANAGAKVLIATVWNQGITPFAAAENAISPERAAVLQRMSERFNAGMRGTILNDGTKIGLVQADEQIQLVYNNPLVFAYADLSRAACTVALPNCTSLTLVTGATTGNFLWADDRRPNVDANVRIGNLAVQRAVNNPF